MVFIYMVEFKVPSGRKGNRFIVFQNLVFKRNQYVLIPFFLEVLNEYSFQIKFKLIYKIHLTSCQEQVIATYTRIQKLLTISYGVIHTRNTNYNIELIIIETTET